MSHHANRVLWMPGGVRTEIQLRGEQSGGALTVLIDHPPEGWVLGPHVHHRDPRPST